MHHLPVSSHENSKFEIKKWNLFLISIDLLRKFPEGTPRAGVADNARPDISGIQQRGVNCVDVKVSALKIMNAIVRLANANARKTMTDISATIARYVK